MRCRIGNMTPEPLLLNFVRSSRGGRAVLGMTILAVLGGMLYAGLKPFRVEANRAVLMANGHGVRFGGHGIVLSQGMFGASAAGRTVEIWIEPAGNEGGTIFSLYDRSQRRYFSVSQDWNDFVLHVAPTKRWSTARESKLYVPNTLFRKRNSFWSVTADADGTAVYRDGKEAQRAEQFHISAEEFSGRVVIGTAPNGDSEWTGAVRGVGIFDRALSAARIEQHYESWRRNGSPEIEESDSCGGLYLFDRDKGNVSENRCHSGPDLMLPPKYTLLYPTTLDPVWRAFRWSKGFWEDAAINYFGFIPLGFLLCAWFSAHRLKHAGLVAAILGSALSLFIELAQTHLPSRDSSMSDLVTNIAGSISGAVLCLPGVLIHVERRASAVPAVRDLMRRVAQRPNVHKASQESRARITA